MSPNQTHVQRSLSQRSLLPEGSSCVTHIQNGNVTIRRKICNNNNFNKSNVSNLWCSLLRHPLSFQNNMIYYCKLMWQLVLSKRRARRAGMDGKELRETKALPALRFGSRWGENTTNFSLCSSFTTEDYHPQSIHHTEKKPFAFYTHPQPYGDTQDWGITRRPANYWVSAKSH